MLELDGQMLMMMHLVNKQNKLRLIEMLWLNLTWIFVRELFRLE